MMRAICGVAEVHLSLAAMLSLYGYFFFFVFPASLAAAFLAVLLATRF